MPVLQLIAVKSPKMRRETLDPLRVRELHEYRVCAVITKRLIRDHGFCAVAIESDFPDAGGIDRYVRGAVEPLDRTEQWQEGEAIQTFPSGL